MKAVMCVAFGAIILAFEFAALTYVKALLLPGPEVTPTQGIAYLATCVVVGIAGGSLFTACLEAEFGNNEEV